ncbi:MAG: hypothetical protein PVF69_09125, partial [Gemmatimonadota bacterium]
MHARFSRILLLFLVFTFRGVAPAAAQERDAPLNLEWWHPVAAGAGVAALTLIDDPVRSFLQDHRSDGLDDIADITKRFKDQEV